MPWGMVHISRGITAPGVECGINEGEWYVLE
jgi:hypothetical protein